MVVSFRFFLTLNPDDGSKPTPTMETHVPPEGDGKAPVVPPPPVLRSSLQVQRMFPWRRDSQGLFCVLETGWFSDCSDASAKLQCVRSINIQTEDAVS